MFVKKKGEYATAIENLDVAWNRCAKDDHALCLKILLLKVRFSKNLIVEIIH